ncbi:hypothetical protein I7I48_02272 [Histoplasma ohiense]|nr:hypothetical protein I7I48_02272 [Histoplasma ohiense (nom. inval.)]
MGQKSPITTSAMPVVEGTNQSKPTTDTVSGSGQNVPIMRHHFLWHAAFFSQSPGVGFLWRAGRIVGRCPLTATTFVPRARIHYPQFRRF